MDQKKKDLLALFIISIIVSMIWMCISIPKYDPMTETGPKTIDVIFCFGPIIGIIIGPIIIKRFIWEIDVNGPKNRKTDEK